MTKTVEEKDQKITEELTDVEEEKGDENGKQAAKNQESHNTYVMNDRQAARNQEGHNTYVIKNPKTVNDLLYKYRKFLIVKQIRNHPSLLCIKNL